MFVLVDAFHATESGIWPHAQRGITTGIQISLTYQGHLRDFYCVFKQVKVRGQRWPSEGQHSLLDIR